MVVGIVAKVAIDVVEDLEATGVGEIAQILEMVGGKYIF